MVEPCGPKAQKTENGGREKLLCSLKNIIRLVEEDSSSEEAPKRCVPDCPCPCNVKKEEKCAVKGPPDAMVRRGLN